MATLIAAYNSEGCVGRCDAKCYNATGEDCTCTCICGGANHGAGLRQATVNTERMAEQWIEEYKKAHPDATDFQIPDKRLIQLALFPEEAGS
jgi:hypothetical protein